MYLADEPLLPLFPEFDRPLPVDRQGRRGGMLAAQGHLGVLEEHRAGYELVGYSRSPWDVVKDQLRSSVLRAFFMRHSAVDTSTLSYPNDAGANATLQYYDASNNVGVLWNENTGSLNDQMKLKYGSSGLAATGAQNNVQAQLGVTMDASTVALDDTLFRATVSGSRVHTEAAATAREIACFRRWQETGGSAANLFMMDRTVIAVAEIAVDQTVAVSYVWQA